MQRTDIGLYSVTSLGLSVFGIGHTLATFQTVRKNVFVNAIADYINHWRGDIIDYWFYIANRDAVVSR